MSRATVPHVLGSKLIGEQQSATLVAQVLSPQLGDLARGVADRNGRPLVASAAAPAPQEIDSEDVADLNGQAPAPALPISATPEVQAAVEALESTVESAVTRRAAESLKGKEK